MRILVIILFCISAFQYSIYSQVVNNKPNLGDSNKSITVNKDIPVEGFQTMHKDSIYNFLYELKYFDNRDDWNAENNLTLTTNSISEKYSFPYAIKDEPHYGEIENYFKSIGKSSQNLNEPNIRAGRFFLSKLLWIDSTNYLGVFVEYFGWERICYAYSVLSLDGDYYKFSEFYNKLDITGIGGFYYYSPFNLNESEFYIIGHNSGEGHESIGVHYFPADLKNKLIILDSCKPAADSPGPNEKLEHDYDYDNEKIKIAVYHQNSENEDWKLLRENVFDLKETIKKLKSSGE